MNSASTLVVLAVALGLFVLPVVHSDPIVSHASTRLEAVTEVLNALVSNSATVAAFVNYKTKYSRGYAAGSPEHTQRLGYFNQSLQSIKAINNQAVNFFAAIGPFADIGPAEYSKLLGLHPRAPQSGVDTQDYASSPTPPTSVNWVTAGKVTDVKDQGQCGSCWSFSTTGSVETLNAIRTGTLVSLSEQQLVSCDTSNNGCDGGFMDSAFQYIQNNKGITKEDIYPYTAEASACDGSRAASTFVSISGFNYVTQNSQSALLKATAAQAVSVGIAASASSFQHYGGGIYDDFAGCGTSLDHAVLVVGYDQTAGYWLVKNQWGGSWGEAGYIRMAIGNSGSGSQSASGICGILSTPMVPKKTAQNPPFPGFGAPNGALPPFPPSPPKGGAEVVASALWMFLVSGFAAFILLSL